mgnify:CR=1 FL=1
MVALASEAPTLLRPLRIGTSRSIRSYYAITVDVADGESAPCSSVMDEHSKVTVTRLGNRVRAAGVAEISGYDRAADKHKAASVMHAARALFPDAGDYRQAA